jgi:hypothetical protein
MRSFSRPAFSGFDSPATGQGGLPFLREGFHVLDNNCRYLGDAKEPAPEKSTPTRVAAPSGTQPSSFHYLFAEPTFSVVDTSKTWEGAASLIHGAAAGAIGAPAAWQLLQRLAENPDLLTRVFSEGGKSGGSAARAAAELAQRIRNGANHVFGPKSLVKHGLEGVLKAFGGDKVAAFNALEGATQQLVQQGAIKGVFETTVKVAGQSVTVRGAVVGGIARVSTAFIP